ncbi:AAA family ATPase [Rhodococcus sp. NPDC019627]|uniref:ATPase AAA-type core domain-containing protein n=1 Tax=Rhodococcus opacus (strain B4) TaxID=632772 RepID=C1BDG4_RHOOB|nr:AAA family ATPase [Rhodococcus opacus]BAH47017.1 hypothetical protein ROP_pROB02-00040 [Rhodococcus opacus B4]
MTTSTQSARRLTPRSRVIQWTVRNFKALEHATLPLDRLNVLVGPNSSGKSSLIQSLLLLAQSTDDEVILNGPLVRLGDPLDVISADSEFVSLGFVVDGTRIPGADESTSNVLFEVTLSHQHGSLVVCEFTAVEENTDRILIRATSERVNAGIRADVTKDSRVHETVLRVREINGSDSPSSTFITFTGLFPEALVYKSTRQQVLSELRRGIRSARNDSDSELAFSATYEVTQWMRRNIDKMPEEVRGIVTSKSHGAFSQLFELPRTALSELLDAFVAAEVSEIEWARVSITNFRRLGTRRIRSTALLGLSPKRENVVSVLALASDALLAFQSSIRYLGPLREEPQVVSPTGARYRALPAGPKGEYTADLLARMRVSEIRYGDWNGEIRVGTVSEALTLWTAYLGVGDDVSVEDQGKLGRGLRIRVNGIERDLTTIGVGASQLIPVLTVVLTAPAGSIVLLEQPELHLHPSVQSRLADFFLRARINIKLVVETHSEYMITRIRRRVVEKTTPARHIAVLFAEQHDGITEMRHLHLDRLGDFSHWPRAFFDTQDEEARALVVAVRKAIDSGQKS